MPSLNSVIGPIVAGDDIQITRTITGVDPADLLSKAWLTIKVAEGDPDPGVIQKEITTTNNPGTGHVNDTGADGTGGVRFDLTDVDTLLLTPGVLYVFDVQVLTANGNLYTAEKGVISTVRQVTVDTT